MRVEGGERRVAIRREDVKGAWLPTEHRQPLGDRQDEGGARELDGYAGRQPGAGRGERQPPAQPAAPARERVRVTADRRKT